MSKMRQYSIAILIVGAVLLGVSIYDDSYYAKLEASGKTTQGTIRSGTPRHSGKRGTKYILNVNYKPDNGQVTNSDFEVDLSFFDKHITGDTITNDVVTVKYLPSDVKHAIIVGGSKDNRGMFWVGVAALVVGAGMGVISLFRR